MCRRPPRNCRRNRCLRNSNQPRRRSVTLRSNTKWKRRGRHEKLCGIEAVELAYIFFPLFSYVKPLANKYKIQFINIDLWYIFFLRGKPDIFGAFLIFGGGRLGTERGCNWADKIPAKLQITYKIENANQVQRHSSSLYFINSLLFRRKLFDICLRQ